jgi:hypothetical protein
MMMVQKTHLIIDESLGKLILMIDQPNSMMKISIANKYCPFLLHMAASKLAPKPHKIFLLVL